MHLKQLILLPLLLTTPFFASAEDGTAAAAIDQTYVLAKKDGLSPKGTILEESSTQDMKDAKMSMSIQGQVMEGTMTAKENAKVRKEFLANGTIRHTIIEKNQNSQMLIMGQPMPLPAEPSLLLKKPIILSSKDGAWRGLLEEGDASEAEQEVIDNIAKSYNQNSDFKVYGGDGPRKIGDEWEVDAADVMGEEDLQGTIQMKFTKVEIFQGKKCAVLESKVDLTGENAEMAGLTLKLQGDLVIHRSLADLVDISLKMNGAMAMVGKMEPQPGMALDMSVKGKMVMTEAVKITPAK